MSTGALERAIRRGAAAPAPAAERCQLCGLEIGEEHRHLLDARSGELRCACQPCSILFDRPASGQGHHRLVPDRRARVDGVEPAALGVPVGLAFFVLQDDGRVLAGYPGPAGATRWEVDAGAWAEATRGSPELVSMAPGVEALLVNSSHGLREAWLVPVDDCYRLAGIVRSSWQGMSGGDRVWGEIEGFFEDLRRRYGQDQSG